MAQTYLDSQGNPVAAPNAGPVYLDDQGNPAPLPVFRSSVTADAGISSSAEGQLKRTDLPENIRAELEAIRTGTAPATGRTNIGSMIGAWRQAGPQRVVQGGRDLWAGNYAKGANEVLTGAGVTALPMIAPEALPAIVAAPGAAALTAGGAAAVQAAVPPLARAVGATPDQADLAGNVAGIGAGAAIAKYGVPALAKWSTNNKAVAMGKAYVQATRDTMAALGVNAEDVHRARPFLEVQHNTVAPIVGTDATGGSAVDQIHTASNLAVKEIEDHIDGLVQQFPKAVVAPVDVAVVKRVGSMPASTMADEEAARREVARWNLDQPRSLADAESLRLRLNAENRSVLEGSGVRQRTAALTNPAYVARQEAANQLREGIYGTLEQNGVQGVRDLRLAEGSILKIRNASDPLTRSLRSESTVARTGTTSFGRRLAQKGLTLGGTLAGAEMGGPLGAAVGGEVGTELGAGLTTKNLSRNQLLERAFAQSFTSPPAMTTQGFRAGQVARWWPNQSIPLPAAPSRLALPSGDEP